MNEKINNIITRGVEEIIPEHEFIDSIQKKNKLTIQNNKILIFIMLKKRLVLGVLK